MVTFKKIAIVFSLLSLVFITILLNTNGREKKIYGTVTDNNQDPLSGVLVILKGTNIKTCTNDNGYFEINVPKSVSTISFYKKGMKPAGADVGFPDYIDVRMVPMNSDLLSDMALEDLIDLKITKVPSNRLSVLSK
jgi:hypothetical protein